MVVASGGAVVLVWPSVVWCCLTRTSRLIMRNDAELRDSFKSMPGSGFVGGMSSGKHRA